MKKVSHSFVTGAVALVFAVLGYQTALLVHYSATAAIIAHRDAPDTVFILPQTPAAEGSPAREAGGGESKGEGAASRGGAISRHNAPHGKEASRVRENTPPLKAESFPFNPNTVSEQDLVRLGFTPKQAESIAAYRAKGGRFRKKEDFAKSFVVSESTFRRLEAYIDIPKIDINKADSAALDSLPGIGGYFAAKIIRHRSRLGGFSYPEQLMDIRNFDEEKFDRLKDLICVSEPLPYPLWELPADSIALHPYIGWRAARGIVLFRENNPREKWTVEELAKAGIISESNAQKLSGCRLRN